LMEQATQFLTISFLFWALGHLVFYNTEKWAGTGCSSEAHISAVRAGRSWESMVRGSFCWVSASLLHPSNKRWKVADYYLNMICWWVLFLEFKTKTFLKTQKITFIYFAMFIKLRF
jgi:hypothetical protein